MQDIATLKQQATLAITQAENITDLDAVRVAYLGKKGLLTDILKGLAFLSAEEKPKMGQRVNEVKREISEQIDVKMAELKERQLVLKCSSEQIDVTLPGRAKQTGSIHPVTQVTQFIVDYFGRLGFDHVDGPEIETEFYNFEALNIPAHHPARAMHDTFYFGDGRLLRTHTSSVQVRAMENNTPPFRLIAPGRVYRCESDATHTPMFHQVEMLVIDKQATFANLKGLLKDFLTAFFDKPLDIRFRPSYFPFTEPSAEVDIQCTQCKGEGCRSCKFTGWLEVLGCGMVHPHVLKAVNISATEYQGFAFGMGIDRLAMLYFGIDDLRMMFEGDLNFLRQF